MKNTATHIKTITVNDPDTHLPVEVEIYKHHSSGGMFGIDSSFLANTEQVPFDPFDGVHLSGPDFEGHQIVNYKGFVIEVISDVIPWVEGCSVSYQVSAFGETFCSQSAAESAIDSKIKQFREEEEEDEEVPKKRGRRL